MTVFATLSEWLEWRPPTPRQLFWLSVGLIIVAVFIFAVLVVPPTLYFLGPLLPSLAQPLWSLLYRSELPGVVWPFAPNFLVQTVGLVASAVFPFVLVRLACTTLLEAVGDGIKCATVASRVARACSIPRDRWFAWLIGVSVISLCTLMFQNVVSLQFAVLPLTMRSMVAFGVEYLCFVVIYCVLNSWNPMKMPE